MKAEEKYLKEERKKKKEEKKKVDMTEIKCQFEYGEWSAYNSRYYLNKYKRYGIQKGNWIYFIERSCLKKKMLSGKYVTILQTFDRAPKGRAEKFNEIKRLMKPTKKK